MRIIDSPTLWAWLHDDGEIAVVDVRDGGPYSRNHILAASSIPLSLFEIQVPRLVPRKSARVVLVDDGDGLARRAADLIESADYSDVYLLDKGNPGWEASGYQLFSGSGIISKAFGELVEHGSHTPSITAERLREWQMTGKRFHLVDTRPYAEYQTVSLGGAVDCPGVELLYRVPSILREPNVPVVVNCAGRTRSIIGTQSLIDFGIENPVFALENGTMGWQLAGYDVLNGQQNVLPEPDPGQRAQAVSRAAHVAQRDGLSFIDLGQLEVFRADQSRTTFVFDVRQADSFAKGHLVGSVNAPGGQLIQATDSYIGIRNSRVVLVDQFLVQSVVTAHWLTRMGWEVYILDPSQGELPQSTSSYVEPLITLPSEVRSVDSEELRAELESGSCVAIDVGESYWYRHGRIPSSYYSMRSVLTNALSQFEKTQQIVFVCGNGSVSPYAAGDALAAGFPQCRYLNGGRAAWRQRGLPVEVVGDGDDDRLLSATDDMWYPPWARQEGVSEAIMQYLTWEVGLLEALKSETYVKFLK